MDPTSFLAVLYITFSLHIIAEMYEQFYFILQTVETNVSHIGEVTTDLIRNFLVDWE